MDAESAEDRACAAPGSHEDAPSDPGLDRWRAQIKSAEEEEHAARDQLARDLRGLLSEVEAIESRIVTSAEALAARPRRASRRYRILLRWEPSASSEAPGLNGPYWQFVNEESQHFLRARPTLARIRKTYSPEQQESVRRLRDEIEEARRCRQAMVRELNAALRALPAPATREMLFDPWADPLPAYSERARQAAIARRTAVERAVLSIRGIDREMREFERELESLMQAFNREGGRNKNLLVRWNLTGNLTRSLLRRRGPDLYQIYKNRYRRFHTRLQQFAGAGLRHAPKGTPGRPRRVVTRQRVREARQLGRMEKLVGIGRSIEDAAKARERHGRRLQQARFHIERGRRHG